MEIKIHEVGSMKMAEIISAKLIIENAQSGIDLLGDLYYNDFDKIIIHQKNIASEFFDLKNGMAGEILQKFSNYRVRLAVVGDFGQYQSKSLNDFIGESNRGKQVNFVSTISEAVERLSE